MRTSVKECLDEHLVDKVKSGTAIPAEDWLASAERHHTSASKIINDDPAGALQMSWSAMHDVAKAAAAALGRRLEGETHGKIADFLACVYADHLEPTDLGLIRTVQGQRNESSYDDPNVNQGPLIGRAVNLAARMIKIATAELTSPGEGDPAP